MKEELALFVRYGTGAVSDALDLLAHNGGLPGLSRRSGSGAVAGPAFTVRYLPVGPGEPGPAGDFIDDVPPGAVVVIGNAGRQHCTVWGDLLSEVAQRSGVRGTVIDGCCRDVGETRALGYSVWSLSSYLKSGKNRVRLTAVQEPIELAGTLVRPGDMVCADDSGALVVPVEIAGQVAEQVCLVAELEAKIRADIGAGVPLREARRRHRYHQAAVRIVTPAAAPATSAVPPAGAPAATA